MRTTILLLTVAVFLLSGCGISNTQTQAQILVPTVVLTIIDQPSFDCTTKDQWMVTIGEVYCYKEHVEEDPVALIKPGFTFRITDEYQEAYLLSYNVLWYQIQSPALPSQVWINAKKAKVISLPCAPLFVK